MIPNEALALPSQRPASPPGIRLRRRGPHHARLRDRARGVYSLANHDVNALMEDHGGAGVPPASEERQAGRLDQKNSRTYGGTNLRADVTPLVDGMVLSAVNTFGGLRNDRARLIDWF